MNRKYLVQIFIDIMVIYLGICLFINTTSINITEFDVFTLSFSIYGLFALTEFVLNTKRKEPFLLFLISSLVAYLVSVFAKYDPRYVISIGELVWVILFGITKFLTLEEIYKKKTNLFIFRLLSTTALIIVGILVSANLYFRLNSLEFSLAFLFLSLGVVEASCDFITFLSEDNKFLKE